MPKLFISTDLGINSSGGTVSNHELKAMSELDYNIIQLTYKDIHPTAYGLPDIPFIIDFLTMEKLSKMDLKNVDLAHMYGGCYPNTIRFLKSKGIKTTYSIMWHDRNISVHEHETHFGGYPFQYIKDNALYNIFVEAIKEADIVIATGKAPRDSMIKEGASPEKIKIIPLGCDIPDCLKPFPDEFRVGYLGAVGPDKGLYYLIKAWELLNYKDSILMFAGDNSKFLELFIRNIAKTGRFHIFGKVENPSDLYNNITIYIQPSVTEGFGMEVPEAMSYGRPVIVSDGAGAADCITHNIDGFVVPKTDIGALAEKIDLFRNMPKDEIQMMGTNALLKAKEYTWDNMRKKHIDLWKSLL